MSIALAANEARTPSAPVTTFRRPDSSFTKPALLSIRFGTRICRRRDRGESPSASSRPRAGRPGARAKIDSASRSLLLPIRTTKPFGAGADGLRRGSDRHEPGQLQIRRRAGDSAVIRQEYVPTGRQDGLAAVFRVRRSSTSEAYHVRLTSFAGRRGHVGCPDRSAPSAGRRAP